MQEPFYNHIIENSGERTARCQRSPGVEGRTPYRAAERQIKHENITVKTADDQFLRLPLNTMGSDSRQLRPTCVCFQGLTRKN